MKNKDFDEIIECMQSMDDNAAVWSMVRALSHAMSEEGITYNQFHVIFDLIDHYTIHEAELMSDDVEDQIDLEGDDGEWYEIPAIG